MENYPIDILQYIVYTLSVLIDMTLGTESVLDSQWTIVQSPNTTFTDCTLYLYTFCCDNEITITLTLLVESPHHTIRISSGLCIQPSKCVQHVVCYMCSATHPV